MSNENKIESYRIMADSLILSSKAKDSSTSDGSSGGSQIPVVAMPTWDINVLENESEDLMARASVRLKKLKSSYGKNVIFRWIKNWRNLRKAVEITTELDQLVPKLKSTEEELNIWLDVLRSQKSTSLSQGMNLISELESSVIECERNMDLFDELHNDCLQVNFDVSNMSTYLFNALTFNIEVLRELQEPRRRSTSRSTQSPVHGHPNYSHGISHAHGHNLHRHHSGKSTKQGSSKAASKQSVHAHVATASNAHRSPLLNGFNATISPASDDEGSPLTLENLKRLEWELRLSPGTDRTVIKSPLTLPLTLSQKDDEQVANEDDAVNRLTQHVEMIEDSSSIIKSEGVFEFLEPANAIISDGDSENENENEDHDDDDLVFDIVGAIPTSLSTSPAVLPALGVPVAATVNRERKLSFEEIMEPAVWQGFSTNQHHRGIIAHTRSSLSGIRYSRNQNGYVYGSADGLILTKKHSSLSAIETYTQIFAMSNEGTSSGVVTINQDSSNTGLSVVSEAKQNDSEVQAKTNQSISNLLLLPKPLARSSSLTYSPPDPNGTADRVLVKSKSLSLSAIDFSTQFPIVNFGSATRTDSLSIPDEHSASPSLIFADLNTDAIQSVATTPLKSDVTIESVSTTTSISSGQGSNRSYVSSPEKSVNNTSGDVLGILSDVLIDAEIPPSDSDAAVQGTKDNHISINTTITSSNFSVPTAKEAVTAAPIIKESSSTEELVSMNAQLEAVTRAIRSLSNSPPPGVLSRSYSFNLDNDRELGTFLKQETLERSRYEAFVLVKEPYIAEDDDHKSMCAKLQLCQEIHHNAGQVLHSIKVWKEAQKVQLKRNKGLLQDLKQICDKTVDGLRRMELRAAGRPVSEESPIMSLSRGFVVEGQSNGAANNSPLVSASSKSRPQSYGGKGSNNMRKSPSHGSLRGILSMLQSGSFQRRGDSSDTDASIKPISGSDTMLSARDTGKPPSGIDISRLRTKSGKNLFKVVAEEAQSTSRSRQPSMTSDEKNARLAPRGILTSSPSTARSGGSGGEPMIFGEGIASGLLLTARPSPSLNNGAKTLEIDSVKIGSSLSYTPSVASQLCAEGNLSDSELASNATNSFDCVDDLKILSGEVERAERALSVVTYLLGHTSEIGKQLRDVEMQLNK